MQSESRVPEARPTPEKGAIQSTDGGGGSTSAGREVRDEEVKAVRDAGTQKKGGIGYLDTLHMSHQSRLLGIQSHSWQHFMSNCGQRLSVWSEVEDGKGKALKEEETGFFILVDECVSGLHVGLVNDWCICQLCSCRVTIRQPAEEEGRGRERESERERKTDRKY